MISGLRNLKANTVIWLDRIELYGKLLAAETKIETATIIRRLIWVGIGTVFGLFAIAMMHMAVITYFWHSEYRILAVGATLLLDIVITGVAFYLASKPSKQEAFAVTKYQLAEDFKYLKDSL